MYAQGLGKVVHFGLFHEFHKVIRFHAVFLRKYSRVYREILTNAGGWFNAKEGREAIKRAPAEVYLFLIGIVRVELLGAGGAEAVGKADLRHMPFHIGFHFFPLIVLGADLLAGRTDREQRAELGKLGNIIYNQEGIEFSFKAER